MRPPWGWAGKRTRSYCQSGLVSPYPTALGVQREDTSGHVARDRPTVPPDYLYLACERLLRGTSRCVVTPAAGKLADGSHEACIRFEQVAQRRHCNVLHSRRREGRIVFGGHDAREFLTPVLSSHKISGIQMRDLRTWDVLLSRFRLLIPFLLLLCCVLCGSLLPALILVLLTTLVSHCMSPLLQERTS